MRTYLYMIRHAVSPFVVGNERERGLSEQGKADAVRINEILAVEGIGYLVSSPYKRAIDTLQIMADTGRLEIKLYEELRERAIASTEREIDDQVIMEGIRQSFADKDYTMPGGESTRDAQKRAIPVIEQLIQQHAGSKIALGTHGNIMTIIMNYFDDKYGYEFFTQISKPDIYKLEFEGMKLILAERLWSKGND
ncbi:phosphoglycerate mutase [Paenibacillus albidus]|uniref:Phosphoglycerate mutase n=1 Tax=Paenibacillus albidus TaxID=2041023 RepID=A0A917FEB8_9BACL|nr:histidine phosphatase family protein [Paenibacillus albidus]GGF71167.1 phosphoglycerate mutase [Paenibacillus albidus]